MVALPTAQRSAERPATVEEWLSIPEQKRAELIRGRIVYHPTPGLEHGNTRGRLGGLLLPYDRRRPARHLGDRAESKTGALAPGGWWISQGVDLVLGEIGCRPDLVGWRRDKHARVPQPDARGVIGATPDFLGEVLSPSSAPYDRGEKCDAYFQAAVPHYWLVDPEQRTLTVLAWTPRGYVIVRVAGPGEVVRAAPFEAVEIAVDELFLDEAGQS
jgi:Uma2 family endonuclease